jgi:hypothetical protein
MRRLLAVAGLTGLLCTTLSAPAQASPVQELWFSGSFTAQLSITSGDVNGDGTDDLVSFNLSGVGNRVLPSTGSAFAPQQAWGNANFQQLPASSVASLVADMDNDGRADAVMVRLPSPRGVWVARSEPIPHLNANRFAPATQWLNNYVVGERATMAADVDADGDMDVIGLYNGGVPVLVARSAGTASLPLTPWGPESVFGEKASLAADVTGDGAADFILADTTGVRVVPANPQWWDTPQQWSTIPFYGAKKTLTGDIDADGDADLIAFNDTDVQVMRSTGTGFDAPEMWWPNSFTGTRETLVADVDGDGDADLVAVSSGQIRVLRTQ